MTKKLLIQIKIPLPDVPQKGEVVIYKVLLAGVKKMFPTEKLPEGSTVDYAIIEE